MPKIMTNKWICKSVWDASSDFYWLFELPPNLNAVTTVFRKDHLKDYLTWSSSIARQRLEQTCGPNMRVKSACLSLLRLVRLRWDRETARPTERVREKGKGSDPSPCLSSSILSVPVMKLFMACRSQINMCSSRVKLLKDLLQDLRKGVASPSTSAL